MSEKLDEIDKALQEMKQRSETEKVEEKNFFTDFKIRIEEMLAFCDYDLKKQKSMQKKDDILKRIDELGIIYKSKDENEAVLLIKKAKTLNEKEKNNLFNILGVSKQDLEDEVNNKERQEKEIIEKIRAKFETYIKKENDIIEFLKNIIQKESDAEKIESAEKRKTNALLRKDAFIRILEKKDWFLEDYAEAILQHHTPPKGGFSFIDDKRFAELSLILKGNETLSGKSDEVIKQEVDMAYKEMISRAEKNAEEEIRRGILEFFGVEIGDRVKVVFDDEEAKEFGVKEDFGIVADARIELVPVEDEAKEPEKEEVIIIKFKNENIGKLFIAKNEENRKDVKKATDEEREKMILSELDEEVKRMSGVLNARMVLGEITRDEHSKKNSVLEWIEKSKDIKTAKEMIGKALNAEGGINEEEARKLYGILEIPEDEINELVKMEELSSEDKIKIKKIKGVISHNRLKLTKLYEDKKDDVIFKGTIKTLDLIEGSRTVKEVIKNIRKSAAIQPLEGRISLGFARDFFKALEMPESEIEKELFLIYVLRTIFDNIPRFEIKGIKREELDLEKILNNEELLNKIAVEDNLKISYTALLGEVDKENWIAKIAEFIKKELAAGGEEKLPEKKEIEIKGFADIERFLVEKKGKPRNARMEEIDARLEEIARILKKAGVTAHKTE